MRIYPPQRKYQRGFTSSPKRSVSQETNVCGQCRRFLLASSVWATQSDCIERGRCCKRHCTYFLYPYMYVCVPRSKKRMKTTRKHLGSNSWFFFCRSLGERHLPAFADPVSRAGNLFFYWEMVFLFNYFIYLQGLQGVRGGNVNRGQLPLRRRGALHGSGGISLQVSQIKLIIFFLFLNK